MKMFVMYITSRIAEVSNILSLPMFVVPQIQLEKCIGLLNKSKSTNLLNHAKMFKTKKIAIGVVLNVFCK